MRLNRLTLRGFQSYETEQVINFDPNITLLAGRNNVGKTALLRSIRHLVEGQPGAGAQRRFAFSWSIEAADFLQTARVGDFAVFEASLNHIARRNRCELIAELEAPLPPSQYRTLQNGLHAYVQAQVSDCQITKLLIPETELVLTPFKR